MSERPRAAVYQRYWATMGGGEQFAAGLALALADRFEVDLVTPKPFDAERFAERLGGDLSAMRQLVVAGDEREVARAVRHHHLFVNATYLSNAPNTARHGLYVVHFPGAPEPAAHRLRQRMAAGVSDRIARAYVRFPEGFHDPEDGGWARWTDGLGVIEVWSPEPTELRFTLSAEHWPPGSRPDVVVRAGAQEVARTVLHDDLEVVLAVPGGGDPVRVHVASDRWNPSQVLGIPDNRDLGVVVRGLHLGGSPRLVQRGRRPSWTEPSAPAASFARTYDRVLSNSRFTAGWVERLWGVPGDVLYPPVRMQRRGDKQPIVLSVGRFFDAASGHSKKQLEMVRAFRSLVDGGLQGWEFHLVGGCDPAYRDYAMQVKREAQGYPIRVHLAAPGALVGALTASASVYWHATGLGEDLGRHPVRAEHFGIALVEAMSAGAVPVVFDAAGPAEIVEEGVSGFRVGSAKGFVERTRLLARDAALRARMADSAADRARTFDAAAFRRAFHEVLAGLEHGRAADHA